MDMINLTDSGRKIVMFAVQILILIACIWYIEFIYYANIYPDKLVKETFEQSNCTITDKNITTHGKVLHTWRVDFGVKYSAQGVLYQGVTSANGLDRSFTTDRQSQEDILTQYDVGQTYPCWFNPDVPSIVVLVVRHNWASTFPLFIPSVIALVMLYYIGRALFEFFGLITIKTREKVRNSKIKK